MDIHSTHLGHGPEDPQAAPPWVSLFLAYAAMLPIVAGAASAVVAAGPAGLIEHLTIVWSGAVLCFLAGVRRGLSFRQPGGPTVAQLATMLGLFVLGVSSLLSPWPAVSLVLQMLGYACMAVLDPEAARHEEVPRYFQRLRPPQMLVPIVSLGVLLALVTFVQ